MYVLTQSRVNLPMIAYLIGVIFTKFSGYQNSIFALNPLTELYSLELLGMLFQIPGATKEAVSVPYQKVLTILNLNLVSFRKSYGFLIIGKNFRNFRCYTRFNFEYFNCKFLCNL